MMKWKTRLTFFILDLGILSYRFLLQQNNNANLIVTTIMTIGPITCICYVLMISLDCLNKNDRLLNESAILFWWFHMILWNHQKLEKQVIDLSLCQRVQQHNLRVERSRAIHDKKAPVMLTTLSPKRLTSKLTIGPDRW